MRVLAFDPGAERMGVACLERNEDGPRYIWSDIAGLHRNKKEPYQKYRLRLIEYWIEKGGGLLNSWKPGLLASEIVPVVGGGNFVVATQSQLASAAITTVYGLAILRDIPIVQLGATTVKKAIAADKGATKVKVRNGVYRLLPQFETLQKERAEWTKIFDESDACAIGLVALGVIGSKA